MKTILKNLFLASAFFAMLFFTSYQMSFAEETPAYESNSIPNSISSISNTSDQLVESESSSSVNSSIAGNNTASENNTTENSYANDNNDANTSNDLTDLSNADDNNVSNSESQKIANSDKSTLNNSENSIDVNDCTLHENITDRIIDPKSENKLFIKDTLGMDSYLYSVYQAKIANNEDTYIKKGDYFTVSIDSKLRNQGITDPSQYAVPSLVEPNGNVIATGVIDPNSNIITYKFNTDIKNDVIFGFEGAYTVNEKVVLENGKYDFTNIYPGLTDNFTYDVVMGNYVSNLTNNIDGGDINSKVTFNLVNVNTVDKTYIRYLLLESSFLNGNPSTSNTPYLGFNVGTDSVPFDPAKHNIEIYYAPENLHDSLYYDTNNLTNITDQFEIVQDGKTALFKSKIKAGTNIYVVDKGPYVSNDEDFVSSITFLLLNESGNEIAQNKVDSTSTLRKIILESMYNSVINKTDCHPHKILEVKKVEDGSNKTLAGAEFQILDSQDKVVYSVVTDENGKVRVRLPLGVYKIVETKAPSGYIKTGEVFVIDVDKSKDSIIEISIKNSPKSPDKPTTPSKPSVPDQPTVPEVPVKPEVPVIPEQPSIPEQPQNPNSPEQPSVPTKTETPNKINRSFGKVNVLPKMGVSNNDFYYMISIISLIGIISLNIRKKENN